MTTFCWLPPERSPTVVRVEIGHDVEAAHLGLRALLHVAVAEHEPEPAQHTGSHLDHVGDDVLAEHEAIMATIRGHHGDAGTHRFADRVGCPATVWQRDGAGIRTAHAKDRFQHGGDARTFQTGEPEHLPGRDFEADVFGMADDADVRES